MSSPNNDSAMANIQNLLNNANRQLMELEQNSTNDNEQISYECKLWWKLKPWWKEWFEIESDFEEQKRLQSQIDRITLVIRCNRVIQMIEETDLSSIRSYMTQQFVQWLKMEISKTKNQIQTYQYELQFKLCVPLRQNIILL